MSYVDASHSSTNPGVRPIRGNITSKVTSKDRQRTAPYTFVRNRLSNSKISPQVTGCYGRKLDVSPFLSPFPVSRLPSLSVTYYDRESSEERIIGSSPHVHHDRRRYSLQKPRVRREWRSLSEGERNGWLTAIKVEPSDPE